MTSPRKIIFHLKGMYGGVDIFSALLANELANRDWHVRMFFTDKPSEVLLPLSEKVAVDPSPIDTNDSPPLRWKSLIRYLQRQAPCIYLPGYDLENSCVASQLSNDILVLGIVHSDEPIHYEHAMRMGRFWNGMVSVSRAITEHLEILPIPFSGVFQTIPYGVDVPESPAEKDRSANRPLKIIYAGRLEQYQKRILDLPRFFSALESNSVPNEITIVGDGPERQRLELACQVLKDRSDIRFLNFVSHTHLLQLFEKQDIILLASEFEGMPIAVQEAMGRACIPVVRDIRSGIPELIRDGENGFVFRPDNIDEIAIRLRKVAEDVDLRMSLSRRAHQTIRERFSLSQMADRYVDLFEEMMSSVTKGEYHRPKRPIPYPPTISVHWTDHLPRPFFHSLKKMNRIRKTPKPDLREHRIVLGTQGIIGGVDVFNFNLGTELQRRGFHVRILRTHAAMHGHPMNVPEHLALDVFEEKKRETWPHRWKRMTEYLETQSPCVFLPNYDLKYSCIVSRLSPKVIAMGTVHSDEPSHYEQVVRLSKYLNGIVSVSNAITDHLNPLIAELNVPVKTIPYGVTVPYQYPAREIAKDQPLRIIYAGRVEEYQKHVSHLPNIFFQLQSSGIRFEATIVGEGKDRSQLEHSCRNFIENGSVRFTGALPNPDVLELYRWHDVILLTSDFEGLPICLLEAMANGCIPVASNIRSGVPEVLSDGLNGFIVQRGSTTEFVQRLKQIWVDLDLRSRLSKQAFLTVQSRFSLERMTDDYLNFFERLIFEAATGRYVRKRAAIPYPPWMSISWKDHLPQRLLYSSRQIKKKIRLVMSRSN